MALKLRDLSVFKPYADEFPLALLTAAGADDECAQVWQDARVTRVAKLDGEVLAVYAMQRPELPTFALLGVVVAPAWRRQGLGRWLTGHALGVAESKGGRFVDLTATGGSRLFERIGFQRQGEAWRYPVLPE